MNKAVKMIVLVCLGVFLVGSFAWAYPSKATLLKDVKALLKTNNTKFTSIKPTNKWDNDWSDSSYQDLGYPNDQCYTFVDVTYPKQSDGSISTQTLRIVYGRPVQSTSEKWSYSDFYPYGTKTSGLATPTDTELLSRVIASMKNKPQAWFKDVLMSGVKSVKQVKISNPSEFEQLTADSFRVNVEWIIASASGNSLLTCKKKVSVELNKNGDIWVNKYSTNTIDSQDISQVPCSQDQLNGMKNLETDGFDAVYSAE